MVLRALERDDESTAEKVGAVNDQRELWRAHGSQAGAGLEQRDGRRSPVRSGKQQIAAGVSGGQSRSRATDMDAAVRTTAA